MFIITTEMQFANLDLKYFVDCQLNPIDCVYGWSTTRGTCVPATFFANASPVYVGTNLSGTTSATDSARWFQHTFVSGIVGSLAQHLIPVYSIKNNSSLRVTLNPSARGMLVSKRRNNTRNNATRWYL